MAATATSPQKKLFVPYSPKWEQAANAQARGYVDIIVCRECHGPVIRGYCCNHCNSTDPR